MKYLFFAFILMTVMSFISCSGSSNPIAGDEAPAGNQDLIADIHKGIPTDEGQLVLGAFQIVRDPITHELDIVPYFGRELLANVNINRYLEPPYCPRYRCWEYELMDYDPVNQIYHFDMMIYNPTSIDVYDARVIFIELHDTDEMGGELYTDNDIKILNPDGWTKILNDPESETEMNPYILFHRQQVPEPFWPNPDRKFSRYSFDVERLVMHWPVDETPGYDNIHGPIFLLAASYPGQTQEALQYLWIEQTPPMNPSNEGFSYITTAIFTHRPTGEDPNMEVYFSCPDILGVDGEGNPVEIELQRWFTGPNPEDRVFLSWKGRVDNLKNYNLVGSVPAMLRASAPNPGDFDTYFKFDFKMRRNPGGSGQTDYDAPVAWTSYQTGDGEIFVADNIFLTRKQNVTQMPDSIEMDPHWLKQSSTDWYLFYSSNANLPPNDPEEDDLDIYVQKFHRVGNELTKIGSPVCMTSDMPGDQRMPKVAPNQSFMVFASLSPETDAWDIYRGDLPSVGDPSYFLGFVNNLTNSNSNERNPTIDPFSGYILFDSDISGSNQRNIYGMVPTFNSRIDLIFQSSYNDMEPAFNPYNPNYFAFTREGDGANPDIWLAEWTGYVVYDIMNLTWDMESSTERLASWAPSGLQIMFQSDKNSDYSFELWVMGIDGEPKDRLTYSEYDDIYPVWGPIP